MTLLEMGLSGALLIAATVLLRTLALNRLPKRTFLTLWWIALARLLVPFSLPSPLSVFALRPAKPEVQSAAAFPAHPAVGTIPVRHVPGAVAPAGQGSALPVLPLVWLVGGCVLALCFAAAYLHFRRSFRTALPVHTDFAGAWCAQHPLRRTVCIRQSDRIRAPLTYGVLHPVILIPSTTDWQDTAALEYAFAHELVHIRRFDGVTKLLLAAALCLHWWNPFVWALYFLANRDLELSCDEAVVRAAGRDVRADYARTLLAMAERQRCCAPFGSHFSMNAMEERIVAIMKTRKSSTVVTLVACALVICITTAFATTAPSSHPKTSDAPAADTQPDALEVTYTTMQEQTLQSYVDPDDGKTYYSWDDGESWTPMTDEEFAEQYPTPDIEWWTPEEYEAWLENEKAELQSIIGSQSYTPSTGWFTWTQEKVDETIAQYEQTLQDLRNGMMISKTYTIEGEPLDCMVSYSAADIASGKDGDGITYVFSDATGDSEEGDGLSFSDYFAQYAAFGLTYQESEDGAVRDLYYNGKLVGMFVDAAPDGGVFTFESTTPGGIDVRTVYDDAGEAIGLEEIHA